MKIAQVVSTYPPYKGGTGNVAYNFSEQLQSRGMNIETFVPQYSSDVQQQIQVTYLKPLFTIGNGAFAPHIYSKVKEADVILLHLPFFGGMESILLRKLFHRRQKLIIYYHQDLIPPKDILRKLFFRFYNVVMLPLAVRLADKILLSSLDYGSHSHLKAFIEKNPEKFAEVPLAVDHSIFKALPEEELRNFKASITERKENKIITFVGNIASTHYFKGIDILLDALPRIKKTRDDFVLCLAGGGDLVEHYKKKVSELGLEKHVVFRQGLSDSELNKLYNISDMVVLPSVNKAEAFGLVLVEAMATGTPVVASNLPGVRTVFEDGVSGYAFPIKASAVLAERLELLLGDKELRQRMGSAAFERAQLFTWTKFADILVHILHTYEDRNHS